MITKTIKFEPPKDNMILFDQFYSNECMIDYDKYGKVWKIEISSKLNIITINTVIKDKIPYDINKANSYIELDYCNEDFTKKYLTTPKSDKNGFSITTKVIKKLFGEEKNFGLVLNLCQKGKIMDFVKFDCKCVNITNG